MKRILFVILLCCASNNLFSQAKTGYTLIPDSNFEKCLIDMGYDSGKPDGKVLTASIANVKRLDISKKKHLRFNWHTRF
ncbi:hypothetical protein C8C82_5403 [Flavobacterium sp. 81]|uniref:hypothetical protein n=1 Tax=Flavobacterium sp. 81 TaxID=2135621 RepID=UPI000EACCBA5|nr:hypothetical protein [Flavobacterium sp. 81]RKR05708.1 hypothetical protein C8C82_5403 [Flavobacterium sp. 81]